MALVLRGANVTAQWYEDDFTGESVFPSLEKFVGHTTETRGWPGYSGGASAPNATYHPRLREIRQHFPSNYSARALRDPTSTVVRENRDRVFQLEVVCYSDKALARSVDGLWVGDLTDSHFTDIAWICIQLNEDLGLPLRTSVQWREGQGTFVSGVRLSGPQFDAYRGILGHVHVSANTHWDPGGFYASRLMAKIAQLTAPLPVPVPTPTGDPDMSLLIQKGESVGILLQGDRALSLSIADARLIRDQSKAQGAPVPLITGVSPAGIKVIQDNLVSEKPVESPSPTSPIP